MDRLGITGSAVTFFAVHKIFLEVSLKAKLGFQITVARSVLRPRIVISVVAFSAEGQQRGGASVMEHQ